jgi:hypothetical protein
MPKDTEGTQASMGHVPLFSAPRQVLSSVKTIVLTAACSEGLGFHSVMGPGTLFRNRGRSGTGGSDRGVPEIRRIVCSPNLNKYDVRAQFGESTIFCRTWLEVLEILEREHGSAARVAVFPCGAIQYGVSEG